MVTDDDVFSTSRLSPRRVTPRLVPLPFGLSWDLLAGCLPGFLSADEATSTVAFEKQGASGTAASSILTLTYRDAGGGTLERTVFVKRSEVSAPGEAEPYRVLRQLGVPTPELLASATIDDTEILILEFLPVIGVDARNATDLVDLVAEVNAVDRVELPLFEPNPGMPVADFELLVRDALLSLDRMTDRPVGDPAESIASYRMAAAEQRRSPTALNHGELYFQQVGRTAGGRLVVFDLETMAVLPRFVDIAAVLTGVAELLGTDERAVFDRYLAALRARTGVEAGGDLWRELLITRVVSTFESLPWLVSTSADPTLGFDANRTASTLRADLEALQLGAA